MRERQRSPELKGIAPRPARGFRGAICAAGGVGDTLRAGIAPKGECGPTGDSVTLRGGNSEKSRDLRNSRRLHYVKTERAQPHAQMRHGEFCKGLATAHNVVSTAPMVSGTLEMRLTARGKLRMAATAGGAIRLHYVVEPAQADPWIRSGALFARRYRLDHLLAARTRGALWQARVQQAGDSSLEASVTIQLLDAVVAADTEGPEGFSSEARAASLVDHPHLARVLDYGVSRGLPFLVFERLEGESLSARLASRRRLAPGEVSSIIGDAARALSALHARGQLHRRLDPAHLFLTEEGPTKVIVGLDSLFGDSSRLLRNLARHLGESTLPSAAEVSRAYGVPPPIEASVYQSPEQILGRSSPDALADLWSLAVIAFECLTGVAAFPGATLGERLVRICNGEPSAAPQHVSLPGGFPAWFHRAVSKDPNQRFASAEEFRAALEHCLDGSAA